MNICVDLTSLADNFSGIERFALSITKEMIKNKKHHWILLFKNSVYTDFETTSDNVEKIIIKGSNKLIFNQIILPIRLTTVKADCYFFPAFPAPFFFFKKNIYNTIHDMSCWDCPGSNKRHMIWYFKIMYWKASLNNKKIVTVSKFSKNRICSILGVKPSNVFVIHNGISKEFYDKKVVPNVQKKYNIPNNYFLCLSTLEPRKNLSLLIRAYSKIFSQVETNLVLAGRKGWLMDEFLSNLSQEVRKKIYFTGFIDDVDLPAIYGNASWFVFPSLYEGFGIPPLEAMAVGTPVLSSDAAAMPEILGDAALYFRSNDVNSLIEALKTIQNITINDAYKRKCVEQAKLYTWEDSAEKLVKLLIEKQV